MSSHTASQLLFIAEAPALARIPPPTPLPVGVGGREEYVISLSLSICFYFSLPSSLPVFFYIYIITKCVNICLCQ